MPATRSAAELKGFFGSWTGPVVEIDQMRQAVIGAALDGLMNAQKRPGCSSSSRVLLRSMPPA